MVFKYKYGCEYKYENDHIFKPNFLKTIIISYSIHSCLQVTTDIEANETSILVW